MTSEICIMNRLAVVLAADSATTATGVYDGRREERHFTGANKIFQLSNHHPVGLMIFDSGDIHNVPWEVIIKSFRAELGNTACGQLDEYAGRFSSYIASHQDELFPRTVQDSRIYDVAMNLFEEWIDGAILDDQDEAERVELFEQRIAAKLADAKTLPKCSILSAATLKEIIDDRVNDTAKMVRATLNGSAASAKNSKKIATALLKTIFSHPDDHLEPTGFVFVGFGERQIFPSMVEYKSYGLACGHHVFCEKRRQAISERTPALLSAFAEASVTNTFELGISSDVYDEMTTAVKDGLNDFATQLMNRTGTELGLIDDLDSLVQVSSEKIGDNVTQKARAKHGYPLVNVLRHLPVEEMAGLAETLITLQSLKVKIATPSERVGGPVDVAVITKHEGLVWLRRKLYFTPELNPRYALRQAARLLTWENDDDERDQIEKTSAGKDSKRESDPSSGP
ncbi:hypothetical protein [Rhizobium sp. GCM10022189]|uniref:hypothetical protein n=1 Tax=Rhizobium sp. GCM10022189 TaxID=3252654 RepID=UPI003613449E